MPDRHSGDASVLHTIPQRISAAGDFTLSLRVARPFRNCGIRISQGGKLVKTVALAKAIPAEMIQIPLRASDLALTGKLEVTVL